MLKYAIFLMLLAGPTAWPTDSKKISSCCKMLTSDSITQFFSKREDQPSLIGNINISDVVPYDDGNQQTIDQKKFTTAEWLSRFLGGYKALVRYRINNPMQDAYLGGSSYQHYQAFTALIVQATGWVQQHLWTFCDADQTCSHAKQVMFSSSKIKYGNNFNMNAQPRSDWAPNSDATKPCMSGDVASCLNYLFAQSSLNDAPSVSNMCGIAGMSSSDSGQQCLLGFYGMLTMSNILLYSCASHYVPNINAILLSSTYCAKPGHLCFTYNGSQPLSGCTFSPILNAKLGNPTYMGTQVLFSENGAIVQLGESLQKLLTQSTPKANFISDYARTAEGESQIKAALCLIGFLEGIYENAQACKDTNKVCYLGYTEGSSLSSFPDGLDKLGSHEQSEGKLVNKRSYYCSKKQDAEFQNVKDTLLKHKNTYEWEVAYPVMMALSDLIERMNESLHKKLVNEYLPEEVIRVYQQGMPTVNNYYPPTYPTMAFLLSEESQEDSSYNSKQVGKDAEDTKKRQKFIDDISDIVPPNGFFPYWQLVKPSFDEGEDRDQGNNDSNSCSIKASSCNSLGEDCSLSIICRGITYQFDPSQQVSMIRNGMPMLYLDNGEHEGLLGNFLNKKGFGPQLKPTKIVTIIRNTQENHEDIIKEMAQNYVKNWRQQALIKATIKSLMIDLSNESLPLLSNKSSLISIQDKLATHMLESGATNGALHQLLIGWIENLNVYLVNQMLNHRKNELALIGQITNEMINNTAIKYGLEQQILDHQAKIDQFYTSVLQQSNSGQADKVMKKHKKIIDKTKGLLNEHLKGTYQGSAESAKKALKIDS